MTTEVPLAGTTGVEDGQIVVATLVAGTTEAPAGREVGAADGTADGATEGAPEGATGATGAADVGPEAGMERVTPTEAQSLVAAVMACWSSPGAVQAAAIKGVRALMKAGSLQAHLMSVPQVVLPRELRAGFRAQDGSALS